MNNCLKCKKELSPADLTGGGYCKKCNDGDTFPKESKEKSLNPQAYKGGRGLEN